jgi:hypothetical protein
MERNDRSTEDLIATTKTNFSVYACMHAYVLTYNTELNAKDS